MTAESCTEVTPEVTDGVDVLSGTMSGEEGRAMVTRVPARAVLTMATVVLLVLALAGLGPLAGAAAAQQKIRYGTIGRSGLNWANYVMLDRGFLAEENIGLEFIVAGSSSRTIQYLVGGSIDLADVGPDATILAVEKGADLVLIGGQIAVPPFRLIAAPAIASVKALKGKKIAASALKTGEVVMTKKILKAHGLGEGDYEIVVIGGTPERYAALKRGAVDATILSQPFDFRAEADGFRGFEYVSDIVKDYLFQATTTTRAWASPRKDLLVRYMRAKIRAHRWIYDPRNKGEAVAILVKNTRLSEADALKTYELWIAERRPYLALDAELNVRGLQNVLEDLVEQDLMKRPLPEPGRYVHSAFYEEALAGLVPPPARR